MRGSIAQVGRVGSAGFAGEVYSPTLAGVGSNGKRLTIKAPKAAVAIVSVDCTTCHRNMFGAEVSGET
jgi:hypothetical protein